MFNYVVKRTSVILTLMSKDVHIGLCWFLTVSLKMAENSRLIRYSRAGNLFGAFCASAIFPVYFLQKRTKKMFVIAVEEDIKKTMPALQRTWSACRHGGGARNARG
ncbi:hypothetical protein [Bifidobacterium colobi]|nr:hypothetical protein [Bifidobacterium colobi]